LRTPSGAPVTRVFARVNGRPTQSHDVAAATGTAGQDVRQITVTIPAMDAVLQVFAENRNAVSSPAILRLKWTGVPDASTTPDSKPKLYLLSVGVSRYNNPEYRLGFAAKDAVDFSTTMSAQTGGVFRDVEVKVLTDDQATREAVLAGLEWLRAQVTERDVGMVLLAGHGLNDSQGRYFFAPANISLGALDRTGVAFAELKRALVGILGKAVFFVDTCNSGNALGGRLGDVTGLINELSSAENGVVVLSASTGKQFSFEDPAWGHGAFTKAILEGVGGKADYSRTGRVTVKMMDLYLSERVSELTKGQQTPVIIAPFGIADFQIAGR
jgi:uncharacterized caspase-like protein